MDISRITYIMIGGIFTYLKHESNGWAFVVFTVLGKKNLIEYKPSRLRNEKSNYEQSYTLNKIPKEWNDN